MTRFFWLSEESSIPHLYGPENFFEMLASGGLLPILGCASMRIFAYAKMTSMRCSSERPGSKEPPSVEIFR